MFELRPLKRITFPQRIATYGVPVAWVVVFTQQSAPFISKQLGVVLGIVYIVCATWYGLLRQLSVEDVDHKAEKLYTKLKKRFIRITNTVADAACAACFLYFLRGYEYLPAPFFGPLFILALAAHATTEYGVQQELDKLLGGKSFNNRGLSREERQALVSLEEVTVV